MGFEPMTSCLLDRRSNQLGYGARHTELLENYSSTIFRDHSFRYDIHQYHKEIILETNFNLKGGKNISKLSGLVYMQFL